MTEEEKIESRRNSQRKYYNKDKQNTRTYYEKNKQNAREYYEKNKQILTEEPVIEEEKRTQAETFS